MKDADSTIQTVPSTSPRRRPRSVTVSDVARLAGVSAMTVSRAVNTPEQVPVATLKKVQDAVAKTGYVPNLLAGGLRSNKSRLVAALVPTLAGPVFMETIQALTAALAENGYQLMLGQSGYAGSREDDLLGAIIGRRPDGIVLTGIMHSIEGRRRLLAAGIPVVETWDLTPTPIDMLVGFSHTEVGRSVCDYLHSRGRRRLAVMGGDDERSQRRNQAFVEAAIRLGLASPPVHLVPAPTSLGSGRTGLRALLSAQPDIDAIFCSSDLLALGVLIEAQAQGIDVPGRLGVMGFGDLSLARDLNPALTTVRIDGTRIGRQAAQYIVDCAEGREIEARVTDIGFAIIERASV
ncbi:MAG: LacI family DNA-binding transcriptional regulator [Polaromonas sp.]